MRSLSGRLCLTPALLVVMAGLNPAQAEPPAALDRVPTSAPVVIGLRNMQAASEKFSKLLETVGAPKDAGGDENPMAMATKMLGTPGLNKTGSMALAIVPGADGKVVMGEGPDATGVIIVPVSDYAAFVKAMGAEKPEGISSVKLDDKPGFVKDLGGGYAALTTVSGLLEKFEGKAGNSKDHAKILGKNGGGIADTADVLIVANVAQMQDQLKDGVAKMKTQAEQMAAMMGEQGAQAQTGLKIMQTVIEGFARDGTCGVLGLSFSDSGVTADIGAQFKDGSEVGKFFNAEGKSTGLLARVPTLPFFFAGAFDLSAPGIKQLFKNAAAMQAADAKEDAKPAANAMVANIDKQSGFAGVLGASPNAMMGGGLFANTVTYTATSDSKAYMGFMAETFKKTDGQKQGPVTTKATYKPEASEVGGVKVDTWTMNMDIDQNDPSAMQVQMMTGMLFGQGGMTGMNAPVEGGVITVYSQNTPLLTNAIEAAKNGKGLSEGESIKSVQSNLPANRTFEVYVGIKPLMDAAIGFASMMGGAPEIKLPEKITPIGLGGTTANQGLTVRAFVSTDTIKSIADVVKQMQAGEEGGDMDADKPADKGDKKPPRF